MAVTDHEVWAFMDLFKGYPRAFGTGKGGWVKRPPNFRDYQNHLNGIGDGIGIGPLMENGRCVFAAIDLDKPDFEAASEMAGLLPGTSWIERSRSGNAHILMFFESPIEAWVVRGIMREALAALGYRDVEVFPKSDRLLPGMFGSYLNLPYYGASRPVVRGYDKHLTVYDPLLELDQFLQAADVKLNPVALWRTRATWLGVASPEDRERTQKHSFGESSLLHVCAQHVLANRDSNPIMPGHRAVVYFNLAKMFSNWSECDHDEALAMMALVNDASPEPVPPSELERMLMNAERRQYTSTGCDDPLFEPYRSPECRIGR